MKYINKTMKDSFGKIKFNEMLQHKYNLAEQQNSIRNSRDFLNEQK